MRRQRFATAWLRAIASATFLERASQLCHGVAVPGNSGGTDIRGTRDLLEGGCGLLVKLGDIDGLAQAMAWVLDRPEAAREMVQRGRKSILAYELQNILKQYEALYAEINNQQSTINN